MVLAAVAVLVVIALALVVGADGWPGDLAACAPGDTCDCEAIDAAPVRQPVNAWSNLAFVAVGLWVLAGRRTGLPDNRMTTGPVYRRTYGGLAVLVGLGSFLFHASVTDWGAWADLVPIGLLFAFLAVYDAARLLGRDTGWFVSRYLAVAGAVVVAFGVVGQGNGNFVLAALAVAVGALEVMLARDRSRRLPHGWLWASLALYVGGGALWVLSGSGGPWCRPDGVVQGHALWHLAAAGAVALLYRYLAGEDAHPTT
jgi:hypothetical protein